MLIPAGFVAVNTSHSGWPPAVWADRLQQTGAARPSFFPFLFYLWGRVLQELIFDTFAVMRSTLSSSANLLLCTTANRPAFQRNFQPNCPRRWSRVKHRPSCQHVPVRALAVLDQAPSLTGGRTAMIWLYSWFVELHPLLQLHPVGPNYDYAAKLLSHSNFCACALHSVVYLSLRLLALGVLRMLCRAAPQCHTDTVLGVVSHCPPSASQILHAS
jgi:hypothetical protein